MQPSTSNIPQNAPSATAHPELATWIAYHGGRLSEMDERHLQNHLINCRRCVQLLLGLADFTTQEPEDFSTSETGTTEAGNTEALGTLDFSKAATWRLLQNQTRTRRLPRKSWLPNVAAAAMLVAVLGFSGWALVEQQSELRELEHTVASLAAPQANTPIFDLRPGGSLRSRQNTTQRLLVPKESGFTLILNLVDSTSTTIFDAHILDTSNTPFAIVEGLEFDELETLTLLMPAGRLPEGLYTVELRGAGRSESSPPLESYSIEIARP